MQLVKKFPAFHGTRRSITALTRLRQLFLFRASRIQSIYPNPTSWRSILILSTHLRLGLHSGLFFTKNIWQTFYRTTCTTRSVRPESSVPWKLTTLRLVLGQRLCNMQVCCSEIRVPVGFNLNYILPLLAHSRKTHNTKHPEICAVCRIRIELVTKGTQTEIVNPAETISVRLVNIPKFDLSVTHPRCSPINRYSH